MSQGTAINATRGRPQVRQRVSFEDMRNRFPTSGFFFYAPPDPYASQRPQASQTQGAEDGASNLLVVIALMIVLVAIGAAVYWLKYPNAFGPALSPSPSPTVITDYRQVIASELNMRERPSMYSTVKFILPRGTSVVVLNEAQQEADGDVWIKVRVQTNEGPQEGWVDARYIR